MKCKICNQKMKCITNSHLRKHNMKLSYYIEKFNLKDVWFKRMQYIANCRDKVWNKGLTKKTDERVRKHSETLIGRKLSEEVRRKLKKTEKQKRKMSNMKNKLYIEHPEIKEKIKNTVKIWAKQNKNHYKKMLDAQRRKDFVSKPQMELYLLIKSKYKDAELEYPIQTNYSWRIADIAIPSLKLDIEYDGLYWHTNKQLDKLRDKHLAEVGWTTLRFNKDNIHLCLNKIQEVY